MPTLLLDIEGTLTQAGQIIPGAIETIMQLKNNGYIIRLMTNIDSRTPETIHAELCALGFSIEKEEIFTPLSAVHNFLSATPQVRILPLLSLDIQQELKDFLVIGDEHPDYVVIGDCRNILDYPLLDTAFRAIYQGANILALQRGKYYQGTDGPHLDTGAIIAALEYATGSTAYLMGKPAKEYFSLAADSANTTLSECYIIGDDIYTDILGGHRAGAHTIQVRTGKFSQQMNHNLPLTADYAINSVVNLSELLAQIIL